MIVVADVLKTISDSGSLELFRIVALTKPDTDMLISKTRLTRKQYYSKMSRLMKAGLIMRKKGKYILSAFGKIIYHTLVTMENAVSNYSKFKVIDSLEMSKDVPAEERKKLIDSLIDNQEIKAILDSFDKSDSQPYADAGQQQQQQQQRQQKELCQLRPELLNRLYTMTDKR